MIIKSFIFNETKNLAWNDCNKIIEDSTEADGFGDITRNPISSLPTTNHLSAMVSQQIAQHCYVSRNTFFVL